MVTIKGKLDNYENVPIKQSFSAFTGERLPAALLKILSIYTRKGCPLLHPVSFHNTFILQISVNILRSGDCQVVRH